MEINTGAPSVIFEMMRSFVVLAKTLNISQTAESLNLTRQTVKRHISNLEEIKGNELFELKNRQYILTEYGHAELNSAETLLVRLNDWLNNDHRTIAGLQVTHHKNKASEFWAQRYPVIELLNLAPPLIKRGFQAWGESSCQIEHPKLKKIRPYLIVYRRIEGEWICVEIGEKSSYSSWRGLPWAQSAIGVSFQRDPINTPADDYILQAYSSVRKTGCAWYDHISTKTPRNENGKALPLNYQRLIVALTFPDGELAIGSLVARTNKVKIDGLPSTKFSAVSKKDLMEFDV
ncbi:MAG: LysR family transcriptional regulator [Pseudomonadota bacterium]